MKRNTSIELYRILLMLGIVLLHCAGHSKPAVPWLGNLLKFCVTGFVFVSGYFGIKFTWLKLGSLYLTALICAAIGGIAQWFVAGDVRVLANTWLYMNQYWFLHAYAVLMMLAPVLNLVFEKEESERRAILLPVIFLLWGWSYCYEVGHLRPFVFPTTGLGAHTPLTLIGVYLLARWFRVSELERAIPKWLPIVAIIALIPIAAIGLAPYNSCFAFGLAASGFLICKRHVTCGAWVCLLAPSVFSVYLLHVTRPGMDLLTTGSGGGGRCCFGRL